MLVYILLWIRLKASDEMMQEVTKNWNIYMDGNNKWFGNIVNLYGTFAFDIKPKNINILKLQLYKM